MNENTVSIRRLNASHIPEILRLEGLCFSYRWNKEQFRKGLAAGVFHVLGALEGRGLAAYLAYSVVKGEMEILNLAVDPDRRRRGVATRLLAAMLEDCRRRGVRTGFLEVKESNTAAIDLYRKFGFNQLGVRKNYYPDTREDALVFRIDLDPNRTD